MHGALPAPELREPQLKDVVHAPPNVEPHFIAGLGRGVRVAPGVVEQSLFGTHLQVQRWEPSGNAE